MNTDITSAFIDLVLAMTTIFGGYLVAYIRRHVSAAAISTATQIAKIAVSATEQMAKSAGWDSGQKLKSALGDARDLGAKHGVRLTDEQWRTLIEREVAEMQKLDTVLHQATPDPHASAPTVITVPAADPSADGPGTPPPDPAA